MKLLFAPGTCSLGIHLLLEEIGKPYETQRVNLQEGAQHKPDFTSVNPKSKVPTLVRDDGSVLTEFPAIAFWLARTNPEAKLPPDDPDGQARALEAMDYVAGTMHPQGFGRIFRPSNFSSPPSGWTFPMRRMAGSALSWCSTSMTPGWSFRSSGPEMRLSDACRPNRCNAPEAAHRR
jgi:glutathione S-transferase